MQFVGERFPIDLPVDEEPPTSQSPAAPFPGLDFVKDIQERPSTSTTARPPTAPTAKTTPSGFPAHKKRTGVSKFKQSRQAAQDSSTSIQPTSTPASETEDASTRPLFAAPQTREKLDIDRENREKLANMSETEIAQEREELMAGLTPSLVERFLRRANIDQEEIKNDWVVPEEETATVATAVVETKVEDEIKNSNETVPKKPKKTVAFAPEPEYQNLFTLQDDSTPNISHNDTHDHDHNSTTTTNLDNEPLPHLHHSIHFPHAPTAPDLDPSSPSFLSDLHSKYFPTLPSDPSKLSWMASPTTPPTATPSSLPIKSLRFSFTGALIPPSRSEEIPVTAGLHHHGDSPEKAGYTVPELAHLARSTVPGQRCMAFQTLGRLLYRLGRGEFGPRNGNVMQEEDGDEATEMDDEEAAAGGAEELEKGLWGCMKEGKVLETMQEEVNKSKGHMSAKAYATEALWLWQKGGGKQVRAE